MEKLPGTRFSTPLSGSAKETQMRLEHIASGPRRRPPVIYIALVFAFCLLCGNLVSCQVKEEEAPDISSADISIPAPPAQNPDMEVREERETLEAVDLDGDGLADSVTVAARFDPLLFEEGEKAGAITVTANLGSGETLEWGWTGEDWYGIWSLEAARLTSPDRDALVLELTFPNSNYRAAEVRVLELDSGELTERFRTDFENIFCILGTYLASREGSPLSAVRVPTLVDKWHAPEWYTLSWNGTGWDMIGDGFFTDTETVVVAEGRELTVMLQGRRGDNGHFGHSLVYDYIQVFDGDDLLQTILPEDVPGDDRFPEQTFLAEGSPSVLVQDINFDGAEDFAVSCDMTRDQGYRWFRWNSGQGRFEYSFSLAGIPELVPQGQKIIEGCWTENWESTVYNIYSFNNRGWLILESTWDTLSEAQNACQEDGLP